MANALSLSFSKRHNSSSKFRKPNHPISVIQNVRKTGRAHFPERSPRSSRTLFPERSPDKPAGSIFRHIAQTGRTTIPEYCSGRPSHNLSEHSSVFQNVHQTGRTRFPASLSPSDRSERVFRNVPQKRSDSTSGTFIGPVGPAFRSFSHLQNGRMRLPERSAHRSRTRFLNRSSDRLDPLS